MPVPMAPGMKEGLRRVAPYLVAAAWLSLGAANLSRGLAHPGVAYRPWAFRCHSYSDLLALSGDRYLGGGRPLPYLEDRIEYPVLLGLTLYLPALAPGGQGAHFTLSVLFLGLSLLAAVALLRRLPGASPWWLAGTPALAYYGALNWDLLPIALLLAAVWQGERRHPGRAGALSALGVSAKLFPAAFLPAAAAELLGPGRRRELFRFALSFAAAVAVVNLPFALLAPANWSFFFRYNALRAAENSVWELTPLRDPRVLNAVTAACLAAAAAAAAVAVRRASPLASARAVRLGTALVLVTWVATNKVYSPQYALYAFAAGALAAAPGWLFWALSAVSAVDYHLAFEVRSGRGLFTFFDATYDLEEAVRTALYAALALFLLRALRRTRAACAEATQ